MTAPARPLTMCAGCGAIVSRHEDCPECSEDPNVDTMLCEECGASGRLTLCICRKPPVAMLSPDDGVEEVDEPCGFCAGRGEISRPFARASELWAQGFDVALGSRSAGVPVGCVRVEGCCCNYRRGALAGLAYLDSLPAHQGFEPPPRPVFRPTVEQMDAWAAQGAAWREAMKGFCLSCGFRLDDPSGIMGYGVECFSCTRRLPSSLAVDSGIAKRNPCGVRPGGLGGGSFLWRRFDRGEMREIDFRFDGGAA